VNFGFIFVNYFVFCAVISRKKCIIITSGLVWTVLRSIFALFYCVQYFSN